jgi:beta-D-xylosidase 4
VADEARALRNEGKAGVGLMCWAPVVNLVRDPRWGRADESPAEDPLVVGRYGVAYTGGLQQEGYAAGGAATLKIASVRRPVLGFDSYFRRNA